MMTNLPRPTFAAIIGAAVLSTLSIGAAIGPARAEAAITTAPSKADGGSSKGAGRSYVPVRM